MNILFMSLGKYWTINESEGYTDLLREFIRHGDNVYILSPTERREGKKTQLIKEDRSVILKVKTGNIQKTNPIEKGISTVIIESQFLHAIKKYFSNIHFDLVLYPTPPITFEKVIEYIKKRDHARTYLLLKDIFPQNAVDLGMMSPRGIKAPLYWYFRRKEKKLYALSDRIGCMSQANVDYVIAHNPEVDSRIVEICPNSIEVTDKRITAAQRQQIREKYGIPQDKTVFIYGGNLGKPQGIPFLIECLKSQLQNPDACFLIVGSGTEFGKLQSWFNAAKPGNMQLMRSLPKEDYDTLVAACDVGMIFLDHRFTIPNFPSRLLSYMQAGLPVLCCTDPNTDIGKVVTGGGFGWWCESNDVSAFDRVVKAALSADRQAMGANAMKYLSEHYTVAKGYQTIMDSLEKIQR